LTDLIKFNNIVKKKKKIAINCRGPGKNVVGDLLHVKPRKVKSVILFCFFQAESLNLSDKYLI
jgi:hypothetical protein